MHALQEWWYCATAVCLHSVELLRAGTLTAVCLHTVELQCACTE